MVWNDLLQPHITNLAVYRFLLITLISGILFSCNSQTSSSSEDRKAILSILASQQKAWNEGDLEKFMIGYLESDSLMFVGSGGIVYGYDNTLERYKRRYSSPELMGKLEFTVNDLKAVTKDVYFMAGAYHLKRDSVGDASGIFTLVWKREQNGWVIAADHSE